MILGYIYYLVPLIQILIAVHVIKTGRSWYWLWIVFGFPMIGAAVYFFVEILPDMRGQGIGGSWDNLLNDFVPGRELRNLQTAFEESDTVTNRKALAVYYLAHQVADKAVELMRGCLTGVFKDDPDINLRYAAALVEAGQFAEAQKILGELAKKYPNYYLSQRELLAAKCLENLGQEAKALVAYEDYAGKNTADMEGWWRYGRLLEKSGQKEKARSIYLELLKKAKSVGAHHRRSQRVWVKAAKTSLKELSKTG